MIDENEIDQGYEAGFAEATADDPKPPAPDLEPMDEPTKAAPAPADDDAQVFADAFKAEAKPVTKPEVEVKPLAPANFKDAFAQARKAGNKVFEFNGKKFTTALKGEMKTKPAPQKIAAAPVESVSAKPQMQPEKESKETSGVREMPTPGRRGEAEKPGAMIKTSAMLPAVAPSAKQGQKYSITSGAPVEVADEPVRTGRGGVKL